MENKLFRLQALEHKKDSGFGTIVIIPKLRNLAMSIFLFIWLPLFVFWFAISSYSKKETVTGWVYPESGVIKIFSYRDGIVNELFVKEGQLVKAGQPLLSIVSNTSHSESGALDKELRNEYSEQLNALKMQTHNVMQNKAIKLADTERKILSGEKKALILNEEILLLKGSIKIYDEQIKRMESLLDKGFVGKVEFENLKSTQMASHINLKKAESELAEIESQNKSFSFDKELVDNSAAELLLILESQQSNIKEKIFQLNNQSSILLTAEADGYVNNLQVNKGQFISRTNSFPLLTITPSHSKLLGQLFIPMRAAGFITSGQQVRLKYDAFPYQKYGAHKGELIRVADISMFPGELGNAPIKLTEAGFLATIELPYQAIKAGGKVFPLKAGMTFSSDITLERRSFFYWFIEPLLSAKESFTE